jgi:uncharacterized protein (TIGR04255 family)
METSSQTVRSSRRIYSKAPIVEAVIDLQVRSPAGLSFGDEIAVAFAQSLPHRKRISKIDFELSKGPHGVSAAPQMDRPIGWRLSSPDNDRILQIQERGFTYSHLPPYTRWEVFENEARPLWKKYVRVCRPQRLTRVAVRYINKLRLPSGAINLPDFLTVYPQLPAVVSLVQGLLMQVNMEETFQGQPGQSVLRVASEPQTTQSDFQSMVLDIDVFQTTDMDPSDAKLWSLLTELRDRKNALFEAALTDRMKESIR